MSESMKWDDAARGIELHRNAVVFRTVVLIVAILYALAQMLSKSPAEPGGFAFILGLAELAATIAALVGIARFAARVPIDAGGLAMIGVFALVVVVGIEIYTLWVLFKVMQFLQAAKHAESMWNTPSMDILDHVERLPTAQIIAGIAGLVAVLVVLAVIASVGRARGVLELARRAHGLVVAVVLLAIAYGAIMHWVEHARRASDGELLMVLAGIAMFGLIVLASYIGTLTRAAAIMRRPPAGDLPEARLVDG